MSRDEERTLKWKEVGYAVRIVLADVPDYEGHITGMYERKGLCLFDHGWVATYTQRGTMDADNITGGAHDGYYELKFEDGSSFIFKIEGKEITTANELPRLVGNGEFVKGTGRFFGIVGRVDYSGKYYTAPAADLNGGADAILDFHAVFTVKEP